MDIDAKVLCDIFKGSRKEEMYLYVARKDGTRRVPSELLNGFGDLKLVTSVVLDVNRQLARTDAGKVLSDIDAHGFYLQLPPKIYALDEGLADNNKLPR
jgi:hypothetical protein